MINSLKTKENIQQELFEELGKVLAPYSGELISEDNWFSLIKSMNTVFNEFKYQSKILQVKEVCNNYCADYILEYDIDFSEGWFLYCHLRKGHLMLKFVPKEF